MTGQNGRSGLSATVKALLDRGVRMPNPVSVEIGEEVDPARISADKVTIHGGCRIRGASTVLSAGATLGSEGPVTIENCRLGPNVALKGGYAAKAVFLDGATLGLGHHVREGSLLEEEAGGAHTVGLKQTILFPFVALGSLINLCDVLMAGGTSRKDHSQVGSSYIHFNYTPSGDKSTPSLFGDVARGVMLDQAAIFLGGQGGAVGPVTVGYGSVVAAGSVIRDDVPDGRLVMVAPPRSMQVPFVPGGYKAAYRMVGKNIVYLANLRALEQWYAVARAPFFAAQELGDLVFAGAGEVLAAAAEERVERLTDMVAKIKPEDDAGRAQLCEGIGELCRLLREQPLTGTAPEELVRTLTAAAGAGTPYLEAVQGLDREHAAAGTAWLQGIIDELWATSVQVVPALG